MRQVTDPAGEELMSLFEPLALDFALMTSGEFLLRQFTRSPDWIRRRVDHLTFEDHRTIRLLSEFHIDFTQVAGADHATWRSMVPLPVQSIVRRQPGFVELRHAEGMVLPQLTRNEERCLIAAGLTLKLLDDEYESHASMPQSWDGLESIYRSILPRLDRDLYGQSDQEPPELPPSNSDWRYLLRFFEENRLIILAGTPHEPPSNGTNQTWPAPTSELRSLVLLDRQIQLGPEQAFQRTVLRAPVGQVRLELKLSAANDCESYHLDVVPPPNVFVERVDVLTQTADIVEASGDTPRHLEVHWTRASTIAPSPQGAHAYMPYSAASPRLDDKISTKTDARIYLRPMTLGFMRPGILVSWLTTVTLFSIVVLYAWKLAGFDGLSLAGLGDGDVNSLVTAIMLGPTLLTAMMIRQDEHLMTKRVVTSHRVGLSIQVSASLLMAVLIAVELSGTVLGVAVCMLLVVSVVVSLFLTAVYLLSRQSLMRSASTELLGNVAHIPTPGGHDGAA